MSEDMVINSDTTLNYSLEAGSHGAITGQTGEESLTFGNWGIGTPATNGILLVQSSPAQTDLKVSKLKTLTLLNDTTTSVSGAIANWWSSKVADFEDIGTINIGSATEKFNGYGIASYGGAVSFKNIGEFLINTNKYGIFLQETSSDNNGSAGASIDVVGKLTVHGDYSGVYVYSASQGATTCPTYTIKAGEIEISGKEDFGVGLYDANSTSTTTPSLSLTATTGSIVVTSEQGRGIYVQSNRSGEAEKSLSLSAENGSITIEASDNSALVTNAASGTTANTSVSLTAREVTLLGGSMSSAVSSGTAGEIVFNADAVSITGGVNALKATNGTVSFKSLTEGGTTEVALNGNTTVSGDAVLNGESAVFTIAEGNTASVSTLMGSDVSFVVGDLMADKLKIDSNKVSGLNVAATGELNDQYGSAQAAAEALASAVSITNDAATETAGYQYSAQAGSVSDAWTAEVDGDGRTTVTSVSENASMAAIADFNAMTLAQWRGEINHLSQRLGDLRGHSTDIGAWARVYGYDAELSDTVDVDLKSNSVQVGADVRVGTNWVVGGAFSYTDQDADFSNGSGSSDGYALAAYAAGYFDCGGYIDVIGRIGRLSSDVSALSQGGSLFDGSYDNTTFGISVETGYRWNLNETFYAEPQAEFSYGFVKGDDFTSSENGVKIEQDDFQSLVGRLGVRAGADFSENKGSVYLQASVNHDFLGDADATATPAAGQARTISTDLGGTWLSYGFGLQYAAENGINFYTSLERANGSEYQENYRYNIGARYNF